jgi:hypothetical protein
MTDPTTIPVSIHEGSERNRPVPGVSPLIPFERPIQHRTFKGKTARPVREPENEGVRSTGNGRTPTTYIVILSLLDETALSRHTSRSARDQFHATVGEVIELAAPDIGSHIN